MKLSRVAPAASAAPIAVSLPFSRLHAEHRMRHQPHVEPAVGEFAHHRVDQERHVVVDDLDHRDGLAVGGALQRHSRRSGFSARPAAVRRENRRRARRAAPDPPARSAPHPPAPRGRKAGRRSSPGCHCGGVASTAPACIDACRGRRLLPCWRQVSTAMATSRRFSGISRGRMEVFTFRACASRATHHLVTAP